MTFTSKLGGVLTVALAFCAVFCAGAQAIYFGGAKASSGEQTTCVYTTSGAEYESNLACLTGHTSKSRIEAGWRQEGTQAGALSPSTMMVGKLASEQNIAFVSPAVSFSCASANVVGEITSEVLGRSTNRIVLGGCSVEGGEFAECEVGSPGEPVGSVLIEAAGGELVGIGNKAEAEEETGRLGERFTPIAGNTLFTLRFAGPYCGHSAEEVPVEGSLIAEFAHPDTETAVQELVQPREPIARALQWVGEGEVREVTSELTVFGEPAALVGKEDLELESGIKWGVSG